ncbi:MAG: aldo/keto reductase [Actinomycetota bacterium]
MSDEANNIDGTARAPGAGNGTPMAATNALGRRGPFVSALGLGTMTFGVETDRTDAFDQLDAYVGAGGNLIDTADVYGAGESERIVGAWLRERGRDDVVVATKGRFAPAPNSAGASRRSLVRSVDASLARLGVDGIDVYFVHGWDDHTPVVETLDTLAGLVRAGKLHSIGWSNVTGWQLAQIVSESRHGGLVTPTVVQPQYNLLDRGIELEILPCCIDHGLSTTPWSPLGGGWLTGKYRRDERPSGPTRLGDDPNRGVEAYDQRNTERTWEILDVLDDVARRVERPMGQVAIAWLASRPTVSSVLLGARTLEQLTDNLGAATVELDQDDLDRLTEVSAPGLPPYPYGMVEDFCDVGHWRRLGTRRPVDRP